MAKTAKYPHRIEFRATTEEYCLAEQLAAQCDLTVSDLLRVLLKQAASADVARSRTLVALYQELGRIHRSLELSKSDDEQHIQLQATVVGEVANLVGEARRIIVQILPLV
jgi:hypothetical protein